MESDLKLKEAKDVLEGRKNSKNVINEIKKLCYKYKDSKIDK